MPRLMKAISAVGTAAMIWVGGGILLHGAEVLGLAAPAAFVHHLAEGAGHALPALGGAIAWIVGAACAGVLGLTLGGALAAIVHRVRH